MACPLSPWAWPGALAGCCHCDEEVPSQKRGPVAGEIRGPCGKIGEASGSLQMKL